MSIKAIFILNTYIVFSIILLKMVKRAMRWEI
jgi:hypothetical protein